MGCRYIVPFKVMKHVGKVNETCRQGFLSFGCV